MTESASRHSSERLLGLLALVGGVSALLYGWISWLSWRFQSDSMPRERPILLTLGLFATLFLLYLFSIRIVRRLGDDHRCLRLVIIGWIAGNVGCDHGRVEEQIATLAEGVFLTLAWFWLLAPTQNPWYWTWALPFLVFTRNRAWLWVSGIVFAYYLRFWLTDHYFTTAVLGSRYAGPAFFDFVVTWIEFFPWFVFLLSESRSRGGDQSCDCCL